MAVFHGKDMEDSTASLSLPSSTSSTVAEASHPSVEKYDLEAGHHSNEETSSTTTRSTLSQIPTHKSIPKSTPLTTTLSRTLSRFRTSDSIDPGPAPDGGRRAWTMAVLAHLVIFNTWGFINSFGVFQTYYVHTLRLGSDSQISWIGSVQVFILFGMGTLSGRATDAGYFKLIFSLGCVLYVFGIFMASLCTQYWQVFLAQGVCVGLGNGLVFVPSVAVTSTYFEKRRGAALGIVTMGSATGGLVFPAIAESLLPRLGYGWTMRVMGLVMGVVAVVCAVFMKPRLPPRKSGPLVEWSAFTDPLYSIFLIGAFFLFWGVYIGFYFVGSFGRNRLGTSQTTSINLLLTMNGVGVLGRMIPSLISDRWTGPLNLLIPFAAITGLLLYSWTAVVNLAGLWAFAVFYGIFAAGIQGLFPVVLTSLTSNPKKVGVRTGMGFGVVGCAVLTGPPLAGALIQIDKGSFVATQLFAGSSMFAACLILIFARSAKVGWTFKARV